MNAFANRLIVFAASALAAGTMAFGQTRMTAEIPFPFQTPGGSLPAGTYVFNELYSGGGSHLVKVQNEATYKAILAGVPMFDPWQTTPYRTATLQFVCQASDACRLRAIRTSRGSLVYAIPNKSHAKDPEFSLVSVPLKVSGD